MINALVAYQKQVDECANCAESFGHLRADDGPVWLTIFVVGHIVVPLAMYMETFTNWSDYQAIIAYSVLALILTVACLPFSKSIFLTYAWHLKVNQ